MYIQSYQIHNVLNVYRKQLSQGKKPGQAPTPETKTQAFNVTISQEGKRQSVIEKVSENIVKKIREFEPSDKPVGTKIADRPQDFRSELDAVTSREKEFTFNVIDQNNQKVTSSISVEDSSVLINRLEQLAQNAVEKDTAE